jgi:hypothetical protein
MASQDSPPITDSPWFWVLAFAGMALAALLAIGPKYGGRQARLERVYQARERLSGRFNSANAPAAGTGEQPARRELASEDQTLVPLWPLALLVSCVAIVAAIMLYRGRRSIVSQGSS